MTGWLKIDSAPKDVPFIGAYFTRDRHGDIIVCWWQEEFSGFISGARVMTMHNGYTFEDGTKESMHSPEMEEPTHWMPLPSPPKETEG